MGVQKPAKMDIPEMADIKGIKLELFKSDRLTGEAPKGSFVECKGPGRLPKTSTVCCKPRFLDLT